MSIKQKLRLMLLGTSSLVLVVACIAFVAFAVINFRKEIGRGVRVLGGILSYAGQVQLDFDDPRGAEEMLGWLRDSPEIKAGGLYRTNGTLLAFYKRPSEELSPPSPPLLEGFRPSTLELVQRVRDDSRDYGFVYLRLDERLLTRPLRNCLIAVALILVMGMLAAALISDRFQRIVTEPILKLWATARAVSREKNYSLRASCSSNDEVGQLVMGFNEMLGQIQTRDEELQRHREHLEEEVDTRTRELSQVNHDLGAAKERAERALRAADAANRAKTQFLANMSHELRTPLNAIIGYSEMLQEEAEELGTKELVPDLEKIHGAGKHLLALINDILDLSKIEAGKMTLFLEVFDVSNLLREVAITVRPLIAKNANRLEVDCAPDVGSMRGDQTKVRQVLFNLLSNAAKFTENGVIRLSALRAQRKSETQPHFAAITEPGDSIALQVADTGIGISPDQLSRLFQPFSQADTSTTRKYGGTGLGLAISKKFCQMMGGDLTVSSEPGHGSTFTVTIPAEVSPSSTETGVIVHSDETRSEVHTGVAGAGDHQVVLVIDDDPAARDLLSRALQRAGFRVELAVNGTEGLAKARALRPAVITLDVMMPGMDGWAVLTRLKGDPETQDIPVVMMTVVDHQELGFALGATDYLTKPIDWNRMTAVMEKYRRRARASLVLVVEDEREARAMLRRALEKQGWRVVEAENGRAGLDQLEREAPDIILLDLMMPEMDGFEFMRNLRQRASGSQVPVIVITARDVTEEDRRRLNGQVIQVLQKGAYSIEDLVREVRQLLRASSSNIR